MHALIYQGSGRIAREQVPDPRLKEATDAIVRVDTTTVCGTDLHIVQGDVPEVRPGTVLGHEAIGEVVEVGDAVRGVRPGDRVLVSCISACGRCRFCREARYGQCRGGAGWVLGRLIDGTQADYVRVPFADLSTHPLPAALPSQEAILLCDVLPTAYEIGVLAGRVRPGDTVVIVGAGPIGLGAVATARLFTPARIVVVDLAAGRLEAAASLGADVTVGADAGPEELVMDLTDGLGADVVMEAVGLPETFEQSARMVRPCGTVANIGVHGRPVTLRLEELWSRGLTFTSGLVDTWSTPLLLSLLAEGRLAVGELVTHRFAPAEVTEAYEVFGRATDTGALKVVIDAGPPSGELATTAA